MNGFYNNSLKGIILLCGAFIISSISNNLVAQTALGTCDTITTNNTYAVQIEGLLSDSTYNITIDGVLTPGVTGVTTFMSGSIDYIDGTDSVFVQIIGSLSGIPDTTEIIVHEVLCIDADGDGDMDYNEASCDFTSAGPDWGTIVSTVAPYNGENVYLYLLTDTLGNYNASTITSNSGHFTGLANGDYKVYAYNFLEIGGATAFLDSLDFGDDLDDWTAGSDPICFNYCGDATYTVDCICPVVIDTEPQELALCVGEDDQMSVGTSVSLSSPLSSLPDPNQLDYEWEVKAIGAASYTSAGDTDSILNLTSVTEAMDSNLYRVVVSLVVDNVTICSDTSTSAYLIVYPEPVMNPGLDETVCSDEISGIILSLEDGSLATADSFDIVSITNSSGLTAGLSNASIGISEDSTIIENDTWTNTSASSANIIYKVAARSSSECISDTIDITLTVDPAPLFSGNLDVEVCSDDITGVVLPSSANINIDSFYVGAEVGLGLTGTASTGATVDTNYVFNDAFGNISGNLDTVTYSVVPFANGCPGDTITILVEVKPEPVFTSDLDDIVCSGEVINITLPSSDDNSLAIDSFDIMASVGTGLTTDSLTQGVYSTTSAIAFDQFTNEGSNTDSVVYTITPYSMGCSGESFSIVVDITTEPVGIDSTLMVCSDEEFTVNLEDLISNGMTSVTFEWFTTVDTDSITGATASSSSSTIIETLTNVTGQDQSVVYNIVPTASVADGECEGDTIMITVTVKPEPMYDGELATVCSGEELNIDLTDNIVTGSVAAIGFTYTVSSTDDINVPAASDRTDTTTTNITDTYTNTTASSVGITYTVTPITSDGCAGDEFTVTVTVDPEPTMATNLDDTVCSDSDIGVTLAVEAGSVEADSFEIIAILNPGGLTAGGSNASTGKTNEANYISTDTWTNSGSDSDSVTYQVVAISGTGCISDTLDIVITIDPEVTVDAGLATTLCSTAEVVMADLGADITGGASAGVWSTDGDGTFTGGTAFGTTTAYVPGTADKANGGVTLTLTSNDADGACPDDSDTVEIIINSVECSTFPWTGNE